ncbi:MAG TPA: GNAT family N-acetyltransferase [Gaiellaceae bacterium]|nr:GNAT family N-acetyltransferase [Gaiellaceae bacterium]
MNLVPSDRFSYAELAELFTRGYEGYFVPMHFDEPTLRYMVETWDIDLSKSRVAPDAGVANLAVRGDRGWIGGIGVVPEQRRNGVGRALMEAVLELAPPTVLLEVIEANEPAIKLYESLGFEKTRVLEVWRVEAPLVEATSAVPSTLGQTDVPWQREDASLPADYERVEVDGGAMLWRGATVFQLEARDEDAAAALLSRGTALNYVNVPEGDVASGALERLGGELRLKQFEMALTR